MTDFAYNIAKGRMVEKIADDATKLGVMLVVAQEAEATQKDRTTLADILANGTGEATATNYARKTGLTATITVDNTNDRVDLDLPDQTWTALGGVTNNSITAAIVFYEEAALEASRIPLTHHDFAITTDGSDVTMVFNAAGFHRDT